MSVARGIKTCCVEKIRFIAGTILCYVNRTFSSFMTPLVVQEELFDERLQGASKRVNRVLEMN